MWRRKPQEVACHFKFPRLAGGRARLWHSLLITLSFYWITPPVREAILTLFPFLLLCDWNLWNIHWLYSLRTRYCRSSTWFELSSSPAHYSSWGIQERKMSVLSQTPSLQCSIRHETDDIMVADKPASLAVTRLSGWVTLLLRRGREVSGAVSLQYHRHTWPHLESPSPSVHRISSNISPCPSLFVKWMTRVLDFLICG